MRFDPGLQIGDKLTFSELRSIFQCGNAGGMLTTRKYQTLVIISDHTKGMYDDEWKNSVLHYTGMGQEGDQILQGNANKVLYESKTNGFTVHLFEVFIRKVYVYQGIVKLVDDPYQTEQLDIHGNMRKVWVFPIQPIQNSQAEEMAADEKLLDKVADLSEEDIKRIDFEFSGVPKEKGTPITRNNIRIYPRSSKTAMNVLVCAKFLCEVDCSHPSFIRKKNNQNYVEPHHLVPMQYSNQFEVSLDVEENIVSLCSNCHNQLHYGRDYEELLRKLYDKRKDLLKQVGIDITFEELKSMYS